MRALRRGMAVGLVLAGSLACSGGTEVPADLVVSNVRILNVDGTTIDGGSIVVRDGLLEAVGSGDSTPPALQLVDGDGLTALPGLIDTHRHLLAMSGAKSEAELRSFIDTRLTRTLEDLLAAGFTTLMSPGDGLPEIREIKDRLASGDLRGPRLLIAGPVFTAPEDHPAAGPVCNLEPFCRERVAAEVDDPEKARARVRDVVEQGVDFIKVVIDPVEIVPGVFIDDAVFEAIADEAEGLGVPVVVHVSRVEDALRAIGMGADKLVHTPNEGSAEDMGLTDLLLREDVDVTTTAAWTSKAVFEALGDAEWSVEELHRQVLANIRHFQDHGVVVAFGTDNPPPPFGPTEFMIEVQELATVLSPREVLHSMTLGAARYLEIDHLVGSLEAGKVADVVLVEGDPLQDVEALERVAVVVARGEVVFDDREPAAP